MQLSLPLDATKRCSACRADKPLHEFSPVSKDKRKRHTYCKPCMREYRARWVKANPERAQQHSATYYSKSRDEILARTKARRAAKPEPIREYYRAKKDEFAARNARRRAEKPAETKAYNDAWRAANKRRYRFTNKVWRDAHPERHRAAIDAWKTANRDLVRAIARRSAAKRKATLANVPSTVTHDDIAESVSYFGGRCAYCLRADLPLEIDHVTAIASGGWDVPENIVPACKSCNSRKSDRGVLYMLNRCESARR